MYNREWLAECLMKRPVSVLLNKNEQHIRHLYLLPHHVHTLMSHRSTETQPKRLVL